MLLQAVGVGLAYSSSDQPVLCEGELLAAIACL